ncbi:MAG: GTP-binding protein [Kofleriaceae bacterium]
MRPTFLEPEYPFEWVGVYDLSEGVQRLRLHPGPDPRMRVQLVRLESASDATVTEAIELAMRTMARATAVVSPDASVVLGETVELDLVGEGPWTYSLPIPSAGHYALFTQHLPTEFALELDDQNSQRLAPRLEREFAASHTHDESVSSVGLEFDRPFNQARLNAWMGKLLRERGNDIFRMKGILDIAGSDRRFVFQGVHMLFDGRADTSWGEQPHRSQVVFIGKRLDRDELRTGLESCLA